jgi:CRP-like cAMP-binding protein
VLRRDGKVEAIGRVPLFAGLSKNELRDVSRLADELDFRAGKVLCRQGAVGREFFVVLEGTCDVSRDGRSIDTIQPGNFFGEVALLMNTPRNATVTAKEPLRTLVITDRAFRDLLKEQPPIATKMLATIAGRLPTVDV